VLFVSSRGEEPCVLPPYGRDCRQHAYRGVGRPGVGSGADARRDRRALRLGQMPGAARQSQRPLPCLALPFTQAPGPTRPGSSYDIASGTVLFTRHI
jgi:hypothetical protein